jgi:Carboxypeptidase regulatory-like domain/FG-GAP-like repeat/FlgD Ig-like domain
MQSRILFSLAVLIFVCLSVFGALAETTFDSPISLSHSCDGGSKGVVGLDVSDLDNDGYDDIAAIARPYDSEEPACLGLWFWSNVLQSFGAPICEALSHPGARDPLISDLDLDGDKDILYYAQDSDSLKIFVAWAGAQGYFIEPDPVTKLENDEYGDYKCMVLVDVDNDGDDDVVLSTEAPINRLIVLENMFPQGLSRMYPMITEYPGIAPVRNLRVADLNADQYPDLLATDYDSGNSDLIQFHGTGGLSFNLASQTAGIDGNSCMLLDLHMNEDLFSDLLFSSEENGFEALWGQGDGAYIPSTVGIIGFTNGRYSCAVDLDGDCLKDVACGALGNPPYGFGQLRVYYNNGDGSLSDVHILDEEPRQSYDDTLYRWVSSGDINGDGRSDLVATGYSGAYNSRYIRVFLNTGDHIYTDGGFSGYTRDCETNERLSNATVELIDLANGDVVANCIGNAAGEYELPFPYPGVFQISASKAGYGSAYTEKMFLPDPACVPGRDLRLLPPGSIIITGGEFVPIECHQGELAIARLQVSLQCATRAQVIPMIEIDTSPEPIILQSIDVPIEIDDVMDECSCHFRIPDDIEPGTYAVRWYLMDPNTQLELCSTTWIEDAVEISEELHQLFFDDFSDDVLDPWIVNEGEWNEGDGVLRGYSDVKASIRARSWHWNVREASARVNRVTASQTILYLYNGPVKIGCHLEGGTSPRIRVYDNYTYHDYAYPNPNEQWQNIKCQLFQGELRCWVNSDFYVSVPLQDEVLETDFINVKLYSKYGETLFDDVEALGVGDFMPPDELILDDAWLDGSTAAQGDTLYASYQVGFGPCSDEVPLKLDLQLRSSDSESALEPIGVPDTMRCGFSQLTRPAIIPLDFAHGRYDCDWILRDGVTGDELLSTGWIEGALRVTGELFVDDFEDGLIEPWWVWMGSWSEHDGITHGQGTSSEDGRLITMTREWELEEINAQIMRVSADRARLYIHGDSTRIGFQLVGEGNPNIQLYDGEDWHGFSYPHENDVWQDVRLKRDNGVLKCWVNDDFYEVLDLVGSVGTDVLYKPRLDVVRGHVYFDNVTVKGTGTPLPEEDSAVVAGIVTATETGDPIQGATITIYPQEHGGTTTTDSYGHWILTTHDGFGYDLEVTAPGRVTYREENLAFEAGRIHEKDVVLELMSHEEFRIVEVAAAPFEDPLEIPEGGIGYAWFVLEGRIEDTWWPVPQTVVIAEDETGTRDSCRTSSLLYTFLTTPFNLQGSGLFGIPIEADSIGTGEVGSQETVTITHVNGLLLPVQSQVSFDVEVEPVVYFSEWGYRIFKKVGAGGHVGVASLMGFAGGGSGSAIEIELSGFDDDPTWRVFKVRRSTDMFVQAEARFGPPRNIAIGPFGGAEASLSFPYGEEYRFDMDGLEGLEALTALYLFIEPVLIMGPAEYQMAVNFLSWVVETLIENEEASGIGVSRIADNSGLDFGASAEFGVGLGIGQPENLSLHVGPSIGTELHCGSMLRHEGADTTVATLYVRAALEGSSLHVIGRDSEQKARLFLPQNLSNTWTPYIGESGFEIVTTKIGWQWDKTRFATRSRSTEPLLENYVLPGSLQEQMCYVDVTSDAVLALLHNATILPNQVLNVGYSGVEFLLDNESFHTDLVHFLRAIHDEQQESASVIVPYGMEAAGIEEFELDFTIHVPLASPLSIGIGAGISASEVHQYGIAEGKFASGLPLLEYEQPTVPTNDLNLMDILEELWAQVLAGDPIQELMEVIENHLRDVFIFWDKEGRSEFVLSPHGSTIDIAPGAIPAGVDSVYSRYWEWGDGTLNDNKIADEKTDQLRSYIQQLRRIREEIAGMRYGIGGFYALNPLGTELLETAELKIRYLDTEVTDLDESQLSVFYEETTGAWKPVVSAANPDSNWVTATINVFKTYTIGPRMPQGEYCFYSDTDSLVADGQSTATLTSESMLNNDESPVEEGALFTVTASDGSILSTDVDPAMDGTQVAMAGGLLSVDYQTGLLPNEVEVAAQSVNGFARCSITLQLLDAGAPAAPVIADLRPYNNGFAVSWEPNTEEDLTGYSIWFDTDEPGPPYEGQASVWGEDSPIEVGLLDSLFVGELEDGVTYYVALTAFDTQGNHSTYSEEFMVTADVIHDPTDVAAFSLSQNAPNPFSPWTVFKYALPQAARVRIVVYDIQGRLIDVLVDEMQDGGKHEVVWDGRDDTGVKVPAGLYFCRAKVGSESKVRKMLMVR